MENRVKMVMADILGVDPSEIDVGTSMDTVATWDSAAHISLMSALEEEFGVSLSIEEIEAMLSFDDILEVLGAKA